MTPQVLVDTAADRLVPDALVVGRLVVAMDGVSFRSLVPNASRAVDVPIERVVRVVVTDGPTSLEVHADDGSVHRFLVPDAATCARSIEQARAARANRRVYR